MFWKKTTNYTVKYVGWVFRFDFSLGAEIQKKNKKIQNMFAFDDLSPDTKKKFTFHLPPAFFLLQQHLKTASSM